MSTSSSQIKRKREKTRDKFLEIAPRLSPIKPGGSNLAYSPVSLRSLVRMTSTGATKGKSLDQFSPFLGSGSRVSGGPTFLLAQSMWIQEGLDLKEKFQKDCTISKAEIFRVDFSKIEDHSRIISRVNKWAKNKTNGLVKDILCSIEDHFTRLLLASVVYFDGKWLHNYFEESETKEDNFLLLDGVSVKVPFMQNSNFLYHVIGVYEKFKVLRLNYKQGNEGKKGKKGKKREHRISMYIFLPDAEDAEDGLDSLMKKVVEPDFLSSHLPNQAVGVNEVRLPKFKISFGCEASEALKKLGLSLPFEFQDGGLTEMVDSIDVAEELFVLKVHHQCFIEVNERGTVAAAVSAEELSIGCSREHPTSKVDFVADHPFIFVIRDDTDGAVLFFGHVLNPLE